jgi:hypothetical protein
MIPIELKEEIEVIVLGETVNLKDKYLINILEERHIYKVRRDGNIVACIRNEFNSFIDLTITQCHYLWKDKLIDEINNCPTQYYNYRLNIDNNLSKSNIDFSECMILTESERFAEY